MKLMSLLAAAALRGARRRPLQRVAPRRRGRPRRRPRPGGRSRVPPPGTPTVTGLGAGDKLRIEVYRDSQVSQSVQIRPDGKITLPLLGDIEAAGRTPVELATRSRTR